MFVQGFGFGIYVILEKPNFWFLLVGSLGSTSLLRPPPSRPARRPHARSGNTSRQYDLGLREQKHGPPLQKSTGV